MKWFYLTECFGCCIEARAAQCYLCEISASLRIRDIGQAVLNKTFLGEDSSLGGGRGVLITPSFVPWLLR